MDSPPSWCLVLLFLEIPQDSWGGEVFFSLSTFLPSQWGLGGRRGSVWTQPTILKGCPCLCTWPDAHGGGEGARCSAGPIQWKHSSPGPQGRDGEKVLPLCGGHSNLPACTGGWGSVSSSPSLGKEMRPQQFQHLECDSKEGLGVGLHLQAVLSSLFNINIVAPCSIAVNIHQKIILVTDH